MNPENTFTPTPQMSLATANSLPASGSFVVNKLDFYEPKIDMPNTLDVSNSAAPEEDIIGNLLNKKSREISGQPYNKFSDMNNPIKTSLAETMRYQNSDLGGYRVDDPNQEYRYGKNQGFIGSVGARAMQFGGNFLSSFLGSFNDIPSIVEAGKNYYQSDNNGLDRFMDAYRGLYDNAGANILDDFNKSIMDSNYTYDTRFTEAHPMSKIVGDIFSSSGFAIGSMLGMLTEDAAISALTGGTALGPVLAGQIAKVGAKFSKILNGGDAALNTLKQSLKAGMQADKAIDVAYNMSKIQKGAFGLNMYTNNIYEASTEAKQAQEAQENKLLQEYQSRTGQQPTGEDLVKIKQAANSTANTAFFGNMLLLAATNKFEFGDIIKRMQVGKEAFDMTEKGLVKLSLDRGIDNITAAKKVAVEAVTEPTTKLGKILAQTRKFGDNFGGYTRSSIGEAVEEGGQFTVSNASEDYYKQKYNSKGLDSANTWYKSLGRALGETVTTTEGWMNMLAGLGGGIVMGAGRQALGLDPDKKAPDTDKLISDLSVDQLSGIVYNMGSKINEHINSIGNKDKGDQVQDWYGHQTTQHNQVFNWAIAALKGRNNYFSIREEQIKTAKELDGADFKAMFGVEDNEENKSRVHGYLDAVLEDARTVKKNYDRVNAVYRNPYGYIKDPKITDLIDYKRYENYKDELIYHLSKQSHNQAVLADLDRQVGAINDDIGVDVVRNFASLSGLDLVDKGDIFNPQFANKKGKNEGILKVREDYLEKQKDLENLIKDGIASKEDVKSKDKLDDVIKTLDETIAEWDTNPDKRANAFKKVYEHEFELDEKSTLNPTDIQELLAIGAEQAKIKAGTERSLSLYNLLATKGGFEKFKDMEMAAGSRFAQQQAVQQETTSDPDELDDEIIDDETYKVFIRSGNQLPKDKKDEILKHIADKIKINTALTEREKKVYARYKTDIDALNKAADPIVTPEPKDIVPTDPIVDTHTGLKEGDILKSVQTKEEFLIVSIKPNVVVLKPKSTGKDVHWTLSKFHMLVDSEQYTLTGEVNTKYTKEEVAALHRKYDHQFLMEAGESYGGARYATLNEDADSLAELAVIPSDFNKKDFRTGEAVKPIVFTRRGMYALIQFDKNGGFDDNMEAPWIYAGRERDPLDKRTKEDILNQYKVNADEAQIDLKVALKEVINSPYATDSEAELARYLIQYIPTGNKVNITADKTYFQKSTNQISIGLDAIEYSPIEVILVHEALHMLTLNGLSKPEFRKAIEEVYNEAKKNLPKDTFRGIEEDTKGDVHLAEFITEALTNQAFMKALASIKYKPTESDSLWKAFINAVQKLFNINTKDTLLDYTTNLIFSQIDTINVRNVDTGNMFGMPFDPTTVYSKVATRGLGSNANPKIISLRNEGKLTPEYIMAHGDFKVDIARDKEGNPSVLQDGYRKHEYKDPKGYSVKFDNLFVSYPKRIIEVHVDGVNIGILQPINTWAFQRSNNFLPLTEMTEAEYVQVTKNLANTYDHFMQTIRTHAQLENTLLKKADGETTKMSSVKDMFDVNVAIGPLAIINNESQRKSVSELEASFPEFKDKKEPFIISLSKAFDPSSNSWIDRPVGYLSNIPEGAKVRNLIEQVVNKNLSKLKGLNARYLTVVSTTGKWESEDDLEFIISHPKEMNENSQERLMSDIRLALAKNQEEGESINGFYITDPSTGKRELNLRVKKGQLFLVSKFANIDKKDYSKPIYLADMDKVKNFDEFVKLVNERLDAKRLFPINTRDFRVDIEDDAQVDATTLATQLVAVTSPAIRNSVVFIVGKINLVNPRANTAEVLEEIDKPVEVKPLTIDDIDLDALNEYQEGDEGEEFDPRERAAPITPVATINEATAKQQAMKPKIGGRKAKYELMTPSKPLIEQYKRECGS